MQSDREDILELYEDDKKKIVVAAFGMVQETDFSFNPSDTHTYIYQKLIPNLTSIRKEMYTKIDDILKENEKEKKRK